MQPKPSSASNLWAGGRNVFLDDQSNSTAGHHCKLHMGVINLETRSRWEQHSRDDSATRGQFTPMGGSVPFLANRGTTPICVQNNSCDTPPARGLTQHWGEGRNWGNWAPHKPRFGCGSLCGASHQWHWPVHAISPPTAYQQHGPSFTGPKGHCCPPHYPQFCPEQYSMLKTPLFMPCTGFRLPLTLTPLPLIHPSSSLCHVWN